MEAKIEEAEPAKQDSRLVRFLKASLAGVAVCGALLIVFGTVGALGCGGGSRGATHSEKMEKAARLAEIEKAIGGE